MRPLPRDGGERELSSLKDIAKALLKKELVALGFKKGRRDGIFLKPLGEEALLYFMCRPRMSSGEVVLEPMIAIENAKLRLLIGEDEPKQFEPRFVHLFLSYTAGSGMTLWSFSEEESLERSIRLIVDMLKQDGIPFAERWSSLRDAIDLLRRDFAGNAPLGVVTHPTRTTLSIIENLPDRTDSIH